LDDIVIDTFTRDDFVFMVNKIAVRVTYVIKVDKIIPVLRKALHNPDPEVRKRAAEMLSDITGEDIKAD